jgi:rhodanese-related sulfurtransferase
MSRKMNARIFLSVNLIVLSIILVFLPANKNTKGQKNPLEQVEILGTANHTIHADMASRYIAENNEDIQFIDLRSPEEFMDFSIPGAMNIPFEQLFEEKWVGYFSASKKTNILYTNNSFKSSMAVALLISDGYTNNLSLNGGLNEWFALVTKTEFTGRRLSARENALFENRRKAKTLFIEFNSLPDSIKNTFVDAKISEQAKLDGGCE